MTVAEVRTESRTSLRNSILRVDTIPLERELEERLGFFVHLRWLAGAGILVGAWVSIEILGADYSYVPLILIGTGVLAYNGLCLSTRRVGASHIYAQIAFDWVALTALVYYTGGVRSPVSLAYSFHIVLGALLLPGVAAWLQAGTASAVIGLMTTAEHFGWWLPIDGQIGLLFPATAHLQCWATLTAFFGISAYLTGSISSALRRKERAVADSQTRLDLAYHEMEALFELGQIAHASLNLEQVLRLIVRRATELMGAKGCSIGLLDHTGQFLEPSASFGLSEAYLSKGSVDVQRSAMVAQALAGEVVQVQDIAADLRLQYPDRARAEGIRAIVCVALQLRSHPIGVIRVYASKSAPAGDRQVAFLRNLANLAAVAIGSARTYAESEALSDERAWFARTTHHQLQTPLAAMVGLLEAIPFAGDLTPEQRNLLLRASHRGDELLALVRDLLDLAHAQRPSLHLVPQPVALAGTLETTLEIQRERAGLKGVILEVDDLFDIVVMADADDVTHIFANLIDNAVKYTPSGGRVEVKVSRHGGLVGVEITDTGIGVDEADRERVFRGFFRTEAAKASGEKGTGVGLSIVRRLVQRWQGHVELDSSGGSGCRFRVLLPAAEEVDHA